MRSSSSHALLVLIALAAGTLSACKTSHAQVRIEALPPVKEEAAATSARPAPFQPRLRPRPPYSREGFERRLLYLPSGHPSTSTVVVERVAPPVVAGNQEFSATIRVTNLTENTLADVRVTEHFDPAFLLTRVEPPADAAPAGLATWTFDRLGPRGTREVEIWGRAAQGGDLDHFTEVDFRPMLQSSTHVDAPKLKLFVNAPTEVAACEPIPVRFHVTNVGEAPTDEVRIDDALPEGLLTADGATRLRVDFPSLVPGEVQARVITLLASKPGRYLFRARTGSGFGPSAIALPVEITVRAASLALELSGPTEAYGGQPLAFDLHVVNEGDGIARNAVLEYTLPAEAAFLSATGDARRVEDRVRWNLEDFAPGQERDVRVVWTPRRPGPLAAAATATTACGDQRSVAWTTEVLEPSQLTLDVTAAVDPARLGQEVVHVLRVVNFGEDAVHDLELEAFVGEGLEVVEVTGPTEGTRAPGAPSEVPGETWTFGVSPSLEAGATARWRIVVRATAAGEHELTGRLRAPALERPLEAVAVTEYRD